MSEQANRIRAKLGEAYEFEAWGAEAWVKQQYDLFLKAATAGARAAPTPGHGPGESPKPLTPPSGGDVAGGHDGVPRATIDRAFKVDPDIVSLAMMPTGKDAGIHTLIMLLWGFEHLKKQPSVSAMLLTRAARRTGMTVARIDRQIIGHDRWVGRSGKGKGTRYILNNPGKAEAARLLVELFK